MAFAKSNAFFERPYAIDYVARDIYISPIKSIFERVQDFIMDYALVKIGTFFHIIVYTIVILLLLQVPRLIILKIYFYFAIIFFPLILIFNILFVLFDWEILKDIQMLCETPSHFFTRKGKYDINLENNKEIIIYGSGYWKYDMKFYGECKKYRSKILYLMPSLFKRELHIQFTKPVTGKLVMEWKGHFNKFKVI